MMRGVLEARRSARINARAWRRLHGSTRRRELSFFRTLASKLVFCRAFCNSARAAAASH